MVVDILEFLARTWSSNKNSNIKEVQEPFFYSQGEKISIPEFGKGEFLPELKGLDRWRVWRFGTFHEAAHVKFSPTDMKQQPDIVEMILEDYRIEKYLLRKYPGYINEQAFTKAVAFAKSPHFEKTERLTSKPMQILVVEYLLQALLVGKVKGEAKVIKQDDKKWIDNFIKDWKSWVDKNADFSDVLTYAKKFKERFRLEREPKRTYEEWFSNPSQEDINSKQQFGQHKRIPCPSFIGSPKTQSSFDKDFKEAIQQFGEEKIKPTEFVKEEWKEIIKKEEDKMLINEIIKSVNENVNRELDTNGKILFKKAEKEEVFNEAELEPIINRLISELQRWKVGWKEVLDRRGDELEVEQFIFKDYEKLFYTEEMVGVKGKIMVLLDTSGSMYENGNEYKKMSTILAKTLDKLGMNFGFYTFATTNSFNSENEIGEKYVILSIKEPYEFLSKKNLNLINGLSFEGGTPTGTTLMVINKICEVVGGIENIIIISDGVPEPEEELKLASKKIKLLRSQGKKIYFIMLPLPSTVSKKMRDERHKQILEELKPNKYVIINDIKELPYGFFRLLGVR